MRCAVCVCVAKLIRELFTEQLKSMQHSLPVLCNRFIYIHCSIFCICWHNFQPQWEKLIWPSSQWGALSAEAEPQGVANVQNCNINTLALTSQQQQQQVLFLLQLLLFNFHWFLLLWLHRACTHTHGLRLLTMNNQRKCNTRCGRVSCPQCARFVTPLTTPVPPPPTNQSWIMV